MSWELVKREDYYQGSDKPFISIASDHIAFNSMFTRIAEIDNGYKVAIYADPDNLKMGFEFHKNIRPNSLALSQASSARKGEKWKGLFCSAQGVINKYPWIESITKLPTQDRRFYDPKKEGDKWTILLFPAFEEKKARETENIPSDLKGIYRYLREDGEVVYIGRGEINARLKSPNRMSWDFDSIEYSVVKNPDMQVKWEAYWLEKFKEQNNGKIPFYNKVSGFEQKSS